MICGSSPPQLINNNRMGMSFGIHSLLGLTTSARDMLQPSYISPNAQQYYPPTQATTFFHPNPSNLFTMDMAQTHFDRTIATTCHHEVNNQGELFN